MNLGLEGKVALVTGGSRLIGFEIARRLGLEGARVAICGRNRERLDRAVEKLRGEGIEVFARVADLTLPEQVEELVGAVASHFGALEILVNNGSGGVVKPGPFSVPSLEEWRLGLELNLMTVISVSKAALPSLKAAPWGRIVNLGAFYLAPGMPGLFTGYAENVVAKTSVSALTKVMAEELAPNITVNCVAPGPVGEGHAMLEDSRNFPVPRPADPGELADLIAFLCSKQAGYLTGLTLPFDGGQDRRVV